MAEKASNLSVPLLEAASSSIRPIEISFPLPKTPHTTVHVHLTPLATSTMVFLSTTTPADSGATMKSLGSFVYAMPDRTNPKSVISTVLCRSGGSLDYANRTARVLALRTKLPAYVGCNLDPGSTGTTAEEEMEGFSKIIDAIMKNWDASRLPA